VRLPECGIINLTQSSPGGYALSLHKFSDKLKEGEEHERTLDKFFSKTFDVKDVDSSLQRAGIDRIFENKDTGAVTRIEYKADSRAASTGNVFLEIVSVDKNNKAGWALTSQSQIIIYYVPPLGVAYFINTVALKTCIGTLSEKYKTAKARNPGYCSVGVLVPLDDMRDMKFVMGKIKVEDS
jgi:hypothetical protein